MINSYDGRRLLDDLQALAQIGRNGAGGADRVAWSDADEAGKRWLAARFAAAGLEVRRDAAANVWGRWAVGGGRSLVLGSHIDSVPNGGHYDGALGVLAGLEVIRMLRDSGYAPPRPIEVVALSDEEGSRFGSGFFGSLALTGQLDVAALAVRVDEHGTPVGEALRTRGIRLAEVNSAAAYLEQVGLYLELHIEQGPALEAAGAPIGIVTAIKGAARGILRLSGEANHAGTTPMEGRRDAGVGAARAIVALREIVRTTSSTAVGTVGRVEFQPGGLNVVPGAATVWFEVRDEHTEIIERIVDEFRVRVAAIAGEEGLAWEIEDVSTIETVGLAPEIQQVAREACEALNIRYLPIASGAGHDAMILARYVPAGLIFVPCFGGKSHSPAEGVADADVVTGVRVLAEITRRLLEQGL